jgi:putative oxidoreductase
VKIVVAIARNLMGLIFFVFGLNGFLHFIPMKPQDMPTGLAGQYIGVLMQSHYIYFVSAVQVIGGALLLVNRYVPLALVLLGPVIVNILVYHILMDPKGIVPGVVVTIAWAIVAYSARKNLSGILAQRVEA